MTDLPFALELNAATLFGALPEAGGLYDQEARFVEALGVVLEEQARIARKKGGATG